MKYYYSYSAPAYEYASNELSPTESIQRLKKGNARFMEECLKGERFSARRRHALEKGQSPFAVIVGCSDSRVPPEEIFDQGLGELFVVRSAGHIADSVTLGSIEYAVSYLGARLIVVLGHQDCGAVCAALAGKEYIGYLRHVIAPVERAIRHIKEAKTHDSASNLKEAILANIEYVAKRIKSAKPYLSSMVQQEKVKVVGALYTFHDGRVTFLP